MWKLEITIYIKRIITMPIFQQKNILMCIFAFKPPSILSYFYNLSSYFLQSLYKRGQLSQLWLWNYHSDWDRKRAHHVRQPFDSFSPPYSDFYDVWFVASNTIFSWRFEVRNEDHFLKLMKLWEVLKKAGGGVKSNGDKLPQGAPSITKAMKQN